MSEEYGYIKMRNIKKIITRFIKLLKNNKKMAPKDLPLKPTVNEKPLPPPDRIIIDHPFPWSRRLSPELKYLHEKQQDE